MSTPLSLDLWLLDEFQGSLDPLTRQLNDAFAGRTAALTVRGPSGVLDARAATMIEWVASGEIRPMGTTGFEIVLAPAFADEPLHARRLTWHVDLRTPDECVARMGTRDPLRTPVRLTASPRRLQVAGVLAERSDGADCVRLEFAPAP